MSPVLFARNFDSEFEGRTSVGDADVEAVPLMVSVAEAEVLADQAKQKAYEEGLIQPDHTYQVGLRGPGYAATDFSEAQGWGFQMWTARDLWHRSLAGLGAEIRRDIGDRPTYVSYDIDFIDPPFAPGTGTPEVGGPNSFEALQVVRELEGLNIIGADMVEVSPPFDQAGGTAFLGVSVMFELLCVMAAGVK